MSRRKYTKRFQGNRNSKIHFKKKRPRKDYEETEIELPGNMMIYNIHCTKNKVFY